MVWLFYFSARIMKIIKEKFKYDSPKALYWGRIYFFSDNKEWKTRILWSASREWVRRHVMLEIWNDAEVERLVNRMVNKWKQKGNPILRKKVIYDPHGITKEEEEAGLAFLREKDKV